MLDLSEAPFPVTQHQLVALLIPSHSRLPSLKTLSLRDSLGDTESGHSATPDSKASLDSPSRSNAYKSRTDLMEIIRTRNKDRWVDVIWD